MTRFVVCHYLRCEYVGVERIPSAGRLVVISNHPSYLDPFTIGWAFRERWVTWMAWQDAFGWPVIGSLIDWMGAFPVDPERPKASTFKQALAVLKAERPLGIFFEGKRSSSCARVDEPFLGAARIALMAKAPVLPVTISGMRRLWDPKDPFPKPGKVRVTCHPLIDAAEVSRREPREARERVLTEQVAAAIESALPPDGRHRFPDCRLRPDLRLPKLDQDAT